jgi:predicted RNA-binding Zn-ribbon protein involved in translation (DUF1610 family)
MQFLRSICPIRLTANFRVGGTSGGAKLILGEWAELGETMVPMYVFVCPNCGKVELFATEELRQRAISLAMTPQATEAAHPQQTQQAPGK